MTYNGQYNKCIKDAIAGEEVLLYRKGMKEKRNDWKELLKFFVQPKDILSSDLQEKYEEAFRQFDNKEAVQPIRNRLGNTGRKAKERELRNVVQGDENTAEDLKIKSISQGEANDTLNAESSSHSDGVATAESRIMITSGDPQPCCSKRMDATEFSEEHGPPRKVQKVKRSR